MVFSSGVELPHSISFYFRSSLKQRPRVKNPEAQVAFESLCNAMIEWGDHSDRPAPLDVAIAALNSPAERVRETASAAVQLIASKSGNPAGIYHRTLDLANARGRLWIAIFLREIVSRLGTGDAIGLMRRLILDRSERVQEKAIGHCVLTAHAREMLPTLYEALSNQRSANTVYRSTRHAIGLIEHGYYFEDDPLDPELVTVTVYCEAEAGQDVEIQSHDIRRRDLELLGKERVAGELKRFVQSNHRESFDWMRA